MRKMKTIKDFTKNQHFVPVVLMQGFSIEYEKKTKQEGGSLYYFDLENRFQNPNAVPVVSQCVKKNYYEVTGKDKEIVLYNLIENVLRNLEGVFSTTRRNIEKKAFDRRNLNTKCFLKSEEKLFLIAFITTQLLRTPRAINYAEQIAKDIYGSHINDEEAANIARVSLLPFFQELKEDSIEDKVFRTFFEPMLTMSFCVGFDPQKRLITSDNAVDIATYDFKKLGYERITFPVSSELCIVLLGDKEKKNLKKKNFLFEINDSFRSKIFESMVFSADSKIYSNHIMSEDEISMINRVLDIKQNKVIF